MENLFLKYLEYIIEQVKLIKEANKRREAAYLAAIGK